MSGHRAGTMRAKLRRKSRVTNNKNTKINNDSSLNNITSIININTDKNNGYVTTNS